ncbi:hypothetical protein FRB95_009320 [Tulasnella sp. JGI-2019a]|nr:hypothetical protein FRB93_013763 [Tulasnella sp. JGI-2019a]KAG9026178.1 hypothetical protein FRB95_009320 [Tulasnella sp. JGI-2019a]
MISSAQMIRIVQWAISLIIIFATFVNAQQTLPPYAEQTMAWDWTVPQSGTVTQCSNVTLTWDLAVQNSTPPMQGPFTFTFFREGYQPFLLEVGNGTPNALGNLTYQWNVQLPVGGPYEVSLADANGAMGGVVPLTSVTASGEACTPTNLVASTLILTTTPANLTECATITVNVTGGKPPYTFEEVVEWATTKTTKYSTGYFDYVLDAKSGSRVALAVTDSSGKGAVGPFFNVGTSNNSSCLTSAPTVAPSSPALTSVYPGMPTSGAGSTNQPGTKKNKASAATVAGGSVGGLAFLILAAVAGVV